MSIYIPDAWVIVCIDGPKEKFYRVLASWYGGYVAGDSWKLSSGIKSISLQDEVYTMPQESGSTYECHSKTERVSTMIDIMFYRFEEQLKNTPNTISYITAAELLQHFNTKL